ncbi:MAG: DUF3180 domain-containing protein [Mycobacteriales bacterium]
MVLLAAGVAARWAIDLWYGKLPPLSWSPAVTFTVVAGCEAIIAAWARPRIRRTRPGLPPVNPLLAARLAVLAKASAMLGALAAGVFVGALIWLLPRKDEISAAANDMPAAIAGVTAGLLLIAAALWLEYVCRVPSAPTSSQDGTGQAGVSNSDVE